MPLLIGCQSERIAGPTHRDQVVAKPKRERHGSLRTRECQTEELFRRGLAARQAENERRAVGDNAAGDPSAQFWTYGLLIGLYREPLASSKCSRLLVKTEKSF